MAAIEKLWGTHEQSRELWDWIEAVRPDLLSRMRPRSKRWETGDRGLSIALFSEEQDEWLWYNCPLDWVKEQIKTQYNGNFPWIDGVSEGE